jgi:cellulose biosynthesis protein BcsQ
MIGRSVRVAEAAGAGQSMTEFEPQNARALEYRAFAQEVERWLASRP